VVLIYVLLYWSQMVLKKKSNFQEKLIYSIYFTR